ncbi:hypothetical protein NDU88_003288 [Pleurodeles waltl]|uniref:Uncharacterized protein n=1 Tax=Pleurodeles waltl TaxID=8319 RepID=A0AAV7NJF8_PLEWA|nr:hypothetical protein NDU88_003288 [Pleurodeles waltl]
MVTGIFRQRTQRTYRSGNMVTDEAADPDRCARPTTGGITSQVGSEPALPQPDGMLAISPAQIVFHRPQCGLQVS